MIECKIDVLTNKRENKVLQKNYELSLYNQNVKYVIRKLLELKLPKITSLREGTVCTLSAINIIENYKPDMCKLYKLQVSLGALRPRGW